MKTMKTDLTMFEKKLNECIHHNFIDKMCIFCQFVILQTRLTGFIQNNMQ